MNIMARDVINMSTPDAWSYLNQSTMRNDKKQRRFSGENRKSLQDALSCSPWVIAKQESLQIRINMQPNRE